MTPTDTGGSVTAPRVCEGSVTATGTHPCVRVPARGVVTVPRGCDGSVTATGTHQYVRQHQHIYLYDKIGTGFCLDGGPRYNVGAINCRDFLPQA